MSSSTTESTAAAAAAAPATCTAGNVTSAESETEPDIIKKFSIKIFKPPNSQSMPPRGITVFLPGTLLKLDSYHSTYQAILQQGQIVVGFTSMNPFPVVGRSHQQMAEDVAKVVQELRSINEYKSLSPKYNLVGHSLGGKVCLMVAAKYDVEHVGTVIALDPVDDRPQELTYPKDHPTTDLSNSAASTIHLFQSENGGRGWFPLAPSDKNATIIQSMYPHQITSLEINKGAGHMSYLDTQSDDASIQTRAAVQEKIRSFLH